MTRRGRKKANAAAAELLRKSLTTSDDVSRLLRLWHFGPNKTRNNVMPEHLKHVFSDTLGLTRSRVGTVVLTKHACKHPDCFTLLCKWLKDRPELDQHNFPFTSINVNYDYAARKHRDTNNAGVSLTRSFGAFLGGQLRYWPDDDGQAPLSALKNADSLIIDTKANLVTFDDARAHSVLPFIGERYSLVFFTIDGHQRAPAQTLDKLKACHVTLPADEVWKFFTNLLSPPKGIRAQSIHAFFGAGKVEKPGAHVWLKKNLAGLGDEALRLVVCFIGMSSPARAAMLRTSVKLSRVLDID